MRGSIEVICGPMFAGKSTELLRRIRRHDIAGNRIRLVKPATDTRSERVHTHDGMTVVAVEVNELMEGLAKGDHYDVLAIDEVQFFEIEPGDLEVIFDLAKNGIRVIFAGVDLDHFGNPFETTAMLMGMATSITKLTAVCADCGELNASRTQWISDLPYNEETRVGGQDRYAPKCIGCFEPMDLDGETRLTVQMVRESAPPSAEVIPILRLGLKRSEHGRRLHVVDPLPGECGSSSPVGVD